MIRRFILALAILLGTGICFSSVARCEDDLNKKEKQLGKKNSAIGASPYSPGKHEKGELMFINGLPVLVVEGTPAQIGTQIGTLTTKPLTRLVGYSPKLLKALGFGEQWPSLVGLSRRMLPRFPANQRAEMEAIAKASKVGMDMVIVGNTLADIKKFGGCATLIIEASRSATEAPLFGRNLDYPTMGWLQDYSLVMIYRPKGKHAFASIGFPGLVGCVSGMNDAGLAVATLEVYSTRDGTAGFDPKGIPYTMCYRRVLEECSTVAEAEKLMRTMPQTTLNNLAICDKTGGAVFEITPKHLIVRRAVEGVCPCTNHFCSKELGTNEKCWRLPILEQCRAMKKVGLKEVAEKLDEVNQGRLTLQTMIFEPATLKLHLAIGKCPASKLPLKELDLAQLFKKSR